MFLWTKRVDPPSIHHSTPHPPSNIKPLVIIIIIMMMSSSPSSSCFTYKLIVEYDGSRFSGFQRQSASSDKKNKQKTPKRPRCDPVTGKKQLIPQTIQSSTNSIIISGDTDHRAFFIDFDCYQLWFRSSHQSSSRTNVIHFT